MLRLRLGRSGAFGLGLGAAGVALSLLPPLLEVDEAVGLGALFALRGAAVPPADVVVISISRDSAAGVGQTSELDEWPRTLHADLIDRLSAEGAAIVAFDVIFDEPRVPEEDRRLGDAVQRAGNVILLERTESDTLMVDGPSAVVHGVIERRVPPIAVLKAGALASAPFALPVVPVRVGQFWTFGRAAGDVPSLPVAALQAYLLPYYEDFVALLLSVRPELARALPATRASVTAGKNLESLMRSIRGAVQRDPTLLPALRARLAQPIASPGVLAALSVLVDLYGGRDSRYLNYYGPARTLRTIPYDRVLSGGALDLAGKMVFVGFSESRQPEQQDSFYSVFSQRSGANLSGVEIGATAFANLLGQTALVPLGMPVHLLLVLVWGALFGTWLAWLSTSRAFAVAVLAAGAYFAIVYWQFAAQSLWLPLIVPLGIQLPLALGVAVFLNYRQLVAQRTRVQTALGYYVPSELAQRLAEQSVHAGANRQLLHGTCLFTDAQEYTTVSESLRPEELAELMNDYYGVMFEVVTRHGGAISDTAGDSMVATWASAQPDAALRTRACQAAIEILAAVAAFNAGLGRRQLPTRVGLESGELFVGNIGAPQRYEYRAIGDIVNTASRIQGLNSVLGTRVLISDAALLGTQSMPARDVGTFLLRGKRTAVRVHEPLAAAHHVLEERELAQFAAALENFRAQRWREAQQHFAALAAQHPADGPSAYYATLCREYERRPPHNWTGAVSVTAK